MVAKSCFQAALQLLAFAITSSAESASIIAIPSTVSLSTPVSFVTPILPFPTTFVTATTTVSTPLVNCSPGTVHCGQYGCKTACDTDTVHDCPTGHNFCGQYGCMEHCPVTKRGEAPTIAPRDAQGGCPDGLVPCDPFGCTNRCPIFKREEEEGLICPFGYNQCDQHPGCFPEIYGCNNGILERDIPDWKCLPGAEGCRDGVVHSHPSSVNIYNRDVPNWNCPPGAEGCLDGVVHPHPSSVNIYPRAEQHICPENTRICDGLPACWYNTTDCGDHICKRQEPSHICPSDSKGCVNGIPPVNKRTEQHICPLNTRICDGLPACWYNTTDCGDHNINNITNCVDLSKTKRQEPSHICPPGSNACIDGVPLINPRPTPSTPFGANGNNKRSGEIACPLNTRVCNGLPGCWEFGLSCDDHVADVKTKRAVQWCGDKGGAYWADGDSSICIYGLGSEASSGYHP